MLEGLETYTMLDAYGNTIIAYKINNLTINKKYMNEMDM